MNLILNTNAAGGNAKSKWEKIQYIIREKFNRLNIIDNFYPGSVYKIIRDLISGEERDLIIAGGDGTVNYFINKMIEVLSEKEIKDIKIGVIGIGSSNDFCKPVTPEVLIKEIPCKINFKDTSRRDVGLIKYRSGTQILHKYFLLNASIGITAEANNLFNNPDFILKFLKRHFTRLAILYSALRVILSYKNFNGTIYFNSYEYYSFRISNLSIIKNPNISGNLSYPCDADYQNGLYDVYLAHGMNKPDLIRLLKSLGKKEFPGSPKTKHCRTSRLRIESRNDFLIEFDGEIISTNYAEFSILTKYLNICVN